MHKARRAVREPSLTDAIVPLVGALLEEFGLISRLINPLIHSARSTGRLYVTVFGCALGVPALVYLPYAIFNYVSPILSVLYGITGFKIEKLTPEPADVPTN